MITWIKALSSPRKVNLFFYAVMMLVGIIGAVQALLPGTQYEVASVTAVICGFFGASFFSINETRLKRKEAYNAFFKEVARTYLFTFRSEFYSDRENEIQERYRRAERKAWGTARLMHHGNVPKGVNWYKVENDLYDLSHVEFTEYNAEIEFEIVRCTSETKKLLASI